MSYNSDSSYIQFSIDRERRKSINSSIIIDTSTPLKSYAASFVDLETQPKLYSKNNRRSYQSLPRNSIVPSLQRLQSEEFIEISKPRTIEDMKKSTVESCENYLKSEVQVTLSDLDLISKMNQTTIEEYMTINDTVEDLCASSNKIKQNYFDIIPYLNQVNEICSSIDYLEVITDELDQFSYYLEEKVNSIKERKLNINRK